MSPSSTLPWRGFHHVALATRDLDATLAFYIDILGMTAGDIAPARGGRGRHVMIRPGQTEAWGLHFFEAADAELFTTPDIIARLNANPQLQNHLLPGALQHIALALPNEAAALALRERLSAHGVAMTGIYDLGFLRDMLFADNNGIVLEAAWPKGG